MRESLFHKIIRLEKNLAIAYAQKNVIIKFRKRRIIPDKYFVDVVTIMSERKAESECEVIDV